MEVIRSFKKPLARQDVGYNFSSHAFDFQEFECPALLSYPFLLRSTKSKGMDMFQVEY